MPGSGYSSVADEASVEVEHSPGSRESARAARSTRRNLFGSPDSLKRAISAAQASHGHHPISAAGLRQVKAFPFELGFLCVVLWLQVRLFNVEAQLDVHTSLADGLGLNDAAFAGISSKAELFVWLSESLVPAVSDFNPDTAALQEVDFNSTECMRQFSESSINSNITSEFTAQCNECDLTETVKNEDGAEQLIYFDRATVLFSGLSLRQASHCSLATVGGRTGKLRSRSYLGGQTPPYLVPTLPCVESPLFANARDIVAPSVHLPPRACYRPTNLTALAETQPVELRQWVLRSHVDKMVVYVPCSSTSLDAARAAQATLATVKSGLWADASTARVDIEFLALSIEYGLLTEVQVSLDFHLGGSTTARYKMRSVSGNVIQNSSYDAVDCAFIVFLACWLGRELYELWKAWTYPNDKVGSGSHYTSVCHRWVRPQTWWRRCKPSRRQDRLREVARASFMRFATESNSRSKRLETALTPDGFVKAVAHVSPDTHLSNFEMADAIEQFSESGVISFKRFAKFVQERGYRPYFSDAWNVLDWCKIFVHGQAVWLLTTSINVPSSAFEQLINVTSTGWKMDVGLWGPFDERPPLLIIEDLKEDVTSINTMQYTCSFLLILQALTFLRIAKGYERLGIVTQTMG